MYFTILFTFLSAIKTQYIDGTRVSCPKIEQCYADIYTINNKHITHSLYQTSNNVI